MPDLFDGGPPIGLQRRLGLVKPRDRQPAFRALLAASIAWVPLLLLNAVRQLSAQHDSSLWSFLLDLGATARFLVASPLLILGESLCLPKLSKIPDHFLYAGLLETEEDRTKLLAAMAAARRLLDSFWVEILAVLFAYGLVAMLYTSGAAGYLPPWHVITDAAGTHFSAAGRWHQFVSLPLLFVLFFGWMWRQLVWWRLLLVIAKLKLKLIAAHPDRAGGLSFLTTVLRGYWPLAVALSAIVAARIGNQLRAGASLYEFGYHVVAIVAIVLAIILAPFTAFVPNLLRLKVAGTFEYGSLARSVGERFECEWLKDQHKTDEALESPEFSATTDLYSIVANVSQLSWFPVGFAPIRALAVVTALPFVPVLLTVIPFDDLVSELKKLLL